MGNCRGIAQDERGEMNVPESFVIAKIYCCNFTAIRIESIENIENMGILIPWMSNWYAVVQ